MVKLFDRMIQTGIKPKEKGRKAIGTEQEKGRNVNEETGF